MTEEDFKIALARTAPRWNTRIAKHTSVFNTGRWATPLRHFYLAPPHI
jgi:hypothetical protein